MCNDFLANTLEGDTVQVALVAQFYMSEVKTQQGRVVVADALDIAALVDGGVVAVVCLPANAVNGTLTAINKLKNTTLKNLLIINDFLEPE